MCCHDSGQPDGLLGRCETDENERTRRCPAIDAVRVAMATGCRRTQLCRLYSLLDVSGVEDFSAGCGRSRAGISILLGIARIASLLDIIQETQAHCALSSHGQKADLLCERNGMRCREVLAFLRLHVGGYPASVSPEYLLPHPSAFKHSTSAQKQNILTIHPALRVSRA